MTPQTLTSCSLHKTCERVIKITLAYAALFFSTLPAQAVNFNMTYGDGLELEYIRGAEAAALYWEDILLDNVTINIHLDISNANDLPTGILGGALPAFENDVSYYKFQKALKSDRISFQDYTAVANLPQFNNYWWGAYYENKGQAHNKINLTKANAKALGLIDEHHSDLDGVILLSDLSNSSYIWERRRNQYVGDKEFDYTSVFIHEIGHILGFVNAIDSIDSSNINDHQNKLDYVTPFNLFTNSDWTSNKNLSNVTYGEDMFFSIDGGKTNLGYLSTGEDTSLGTYGKGDGWQASHWKNNIDSIMNPALAPGDRRDTTDLDLQVFDVLGWDIDYTRDLSNSYIVDQSFINAKSVAITDNNYAIEKMFNQYRWGRSSSSRSSFRQDQDLADYLAQEGLFQAGTFWSHMPTEAASVPEPTSTAGLFALGLLGFVAGRNRKQGQEK